MKQQPIIDLHCDLLGCIEANSGKLNFDSPSLNCSLPQLIAGNVKLQVLAVAAITQPGSAQTGLNQLILYQKLLQKNNAAPFSTFTIDSPNTHFILAIENASALIEEDEPLSLFFARLENITEKIFYISLTWNQENRFGGGNLTTVGLKPDGKELLNYLNNRKIAIDFSHTSDQLAHDILNYIEQNNLNIPLMASHSNYRPIYSHLRNLPDEITQHIMAKQGLIGLLFVKRFVGSSFETLIDHIDHALSLGAEKALAMGSDFYGGLSIDPKLCPGKETSPFFSELANASHFPHLTQLLSSHYDPQLVNKICYQNCLDFISCHLS